MILQRPRRPHDLQRLAPGPARLAIGQRPPTAIHQSPSNVIIYVQANPAGAYYDDEGDAGVCDCDCPSTIVIHSPVLLSARVAINIDGVELARLAAFLDERCEADVVVPGEREGEKVSLRMRDSTLADVIEAAGLTIRDSEPPATTY